MQSSTLALLLVGLLAVSGVWAVKKETGVKKAGPKCNIQCSTDNFQPICAGDGSNKPLSFGSQCVLDKYNCEHNTNLKKQKDGECPNSGGIRLA